MLSPYQMYQRPQQQPQQQVLKPIDKMRRGMDRPYSAQDQIQQQQDPNDILKYLKALLAGNQGY